MSLPDQWVHHPVAVVNPPLIAMGADGSGSMVYGMPPVRISRECGRCGRWMDDSCFRSLARACRPCEEYWIQTSSSSSVAIQEKHSVRLTSSLYTSFFLHQEVAQRFFVNGNHPAVRWWRRNATKPPTKRQGGDAANQNRTVAALESFSNGPLAGARSPHREPAVNRPSTDPEPQNRDKLEQFLDGGSTAGARSDTQKSLKTQSSRAATVPDPLKSADRATHDKENRPNDPR